MVRQLARIWEELGEGKSDQNILYRFFFFFEGFLFSYNKNARKYQELVQLLTNAARNRLLSLS